GFRHKRRAALLSAGDEMDLRRVIKRVEHFEIALAGDAERDLDAMRAQRRDDELTTALQGKIRRHRCVLMPPIGNTIVKRSRERTREAIRRSAPATARFAIAGAAARTQSRGRGPRKCSAGRTAVGGVLGGGWAA